MIQVGEFLLYMRRTSVTRNELRSGETLDFHLYDDNWTEMDFNDSEWGGVTVKKTKPCRRAAKMLLSTHSRNMYA